MKILYIHQYFKTLDEGGAVRSYFIAKGMVHAGISVNVITSHNSKEIIVKDIEGIKVHYLPVFYENDFGFVKRLLSFLRFILVAISYSKKIDYDLCYATSTPLSVGLIAVWNKLRLKKPFYFEVRDIWPEAPVQLGILRNRVMIFLAYKIEKFIYHRAEKIVCLSPAIENDIKKRYLYLNTIRVPNMSDCIFYNAEEKKDYLLKKYDVTRNEFIISYFGALGWVNNLECLMDAALECQKNKLPVRFFIAGKGGQENKLKSYAVSLGLKNMEFIGHINKYELRELLNITDAAYISFLNNKVLEANSPNKFFDGLASGKVIITNVKGWIKDLVNEHDCGFYINPAIPEDLANKLKTYLSDEEHIEQQKINARKLGQDQFSRSVLVKKLINDIQPSIDQKALHIGL